MLSCFKRLNVLCYMQHMPLTAELLCGPDSAILSGSVSAQVNSCHGLLRSGNHKDEVEHWHVSELSVFVKKTELALPEQQGPV